jgi:hypothetical protein
MTIFIGKFISEKLNSTMSQLAQSILSQAQSLPEGGLLSPKEFLHLGSRAAIDQVPSHAWLAKESCSELAEAFIPANSGTVWHTPSLYRIRHGSD